MAEKFNLASVLGDVSKLNSETEQIVRIDLDRIDPDPDNFYSLDGLDELAANIELIGLQQPLRVRPSGERYIIVSGHRRRAAIQLIRDGGSEQFSAGVPCIVEYGEASDAMRKLRLIYANAATRVMSSAEISKQAEEVSMLLYQLKQQGVEFPGRMREHVAQACKISTSKLARLHAIRNNLDSNLLKYYDSGELNEDAAYKLSQFPQEIQEAVGEELASGKRKRCPSGVVVDAVQRNLKELQAGELSCRAHAGGPDCHNRQERIVRSIFAQYDWQICTPGRCCMDCYHLSGCGGACREAKDRLKLDKAVEDEKQKERMAAEKTRFQVTKDAVVRRCRQLLPLIDAAGLKDEEKIFPGHEAAKVGEIRDWAANGAPSRTFYSDVCVQPWKVEDLKGMAKKLKISVSELLGEKVEAKPAPQPAETDDLNDPDDGDVYILNAWHKGKPPEENEGWYAAKVRVAGTDLIVRKCLFWWGDVGEWTINDNPRSSTLDDANEVICWYPLPDDEEV